MKEVAITGETENIFFCWVFNKGVTKLVKILWYLSEKADLSKKQETWTFDGRIPNIHLYFVIKANLISFGKFPHLLFDDVSVLA